MTSREKKYIEFDYRHKETLEALIGCTYIYMDRQTIKLLFTFINFLSGIKCFYDISMN